MNFSRFHHENRKNRVYPFNPCSQNGSIPSLHSLSIRLFSKYCSLTIFNPFNFMAREFSVESFRMEIFRVFEGLVTSCLTTNCKYIEDRSEKDGVLTVGKRRLFSRKRRVRGAKTSFFETKDFVFFRKDGVFSFEAIFLSF